MILKLDKFDLTDKTRLVVALFFFLLILILFSTTPPESNRMGKIVSIEAGETVRGTAKILKSNNVIRSETLFNIIIALSGGHVVEGDYFFHQPLNIFKVAKKISLGTYEIPVKQITFYEGMSVNQMAERLKDELPNFNATGFVELATPYEGYLFPDTYIFNVNASPETVINIMRDNFENKITENMDLIDKSDRTLVEIVTMASIVEREATRDTVQEVSDILWRRIDIGMALQVDAPFVYALNKGTFDLTREDLETDHPYNTYVNTGLTPTPISNPGIESIMAAANPRKTKYLYFLTGYDGQMYFASTFEEHKQNRLLYLD